MHSEDEKRKIRLRLLQALLAILVLSSSCKGEAKALSVDEVVSAGVRVPIYYPDPSSGYAELEVVYYYSDDSSEVLLTTYFLTKDSNSQIARVARMSTFNLNGQLVNTDETKEDPSVPITWAKDGGGACKVFSQVYRNDRITGGRFQSCLYWLDEDLNQYKLYTVWSEEEAVNFANSLIVLEE
jgi:hypothetical protein